MTRRDGMAIDRALKAARTRSRASLTALSGRPTIPNDGSPALTEACTSTSRASTPSNATVKAIATMPVSCCPENG